MRRIENLTGGLGGLQVGFRGCWCQLVAHCPAGDFYAAHCKEAHAQGVVAKYFYPAEVGGGVVGEGDTLSEAPERYAQGVC